MAKVISTIKVNATQLEEIVKHCIESGTNLYISGPKGVGKTEIVNQVCTKLSVPMFKHRLADCEPSDLRGLPIVAGNDEDGKPIMKFSRPDDIPPASGKCLWFLDELNRANRSVMNSVMQVTDSTKRVGSHKLSRDMVVVASGNPSSDNNYDVGELDAALSNRFLHVVVDYDVDVLLKYATEKNWNEHVLDFMKVSKADLFSTAGGTDEASCTPRSLEMLSDLVNKTKDVSKAVALAMFQGCIGPELGKAFFAFLYELRPVKFKELLTIKGQAKLVDQCKDANYRADLLNLTLDDIIKNLTGKKTITDKEAEAVHCFLTHVQAEQSASAIAKLVTTCKDVLLHPTIASSTELRDRLHRVS